MARYAVIDGASVVNVIEADPSFTLSGFTLVASDAAGPGWTYDGQTFFPPSFDLARAKIGLIARIDEKRDVLLAAGLSVSELHVDLTDASRTDLGGMATTALAASSGAVPWPASYAQGWISMENQRIPLATPADGLALAANAGARYAAVVQNARTLKDAALGATDQASLEAVNVEAGWPG